MKQQRRPPHKPSRHSAPAARIPAGGNDDDLSQWATEKEAEDSFGFKDRTLNRRVRDGLVQKKMFSRPGRVPEARYYIPDLERLTAVQAFPMPALDQALAVRPAMQQQPAVSLERAIQLLAAAHQPQAAPLGPAPTSWMTLEEASAHCGLSAKLLRSLIRKKLLPALRDEKVWKVHRDDLDNLRPNRIAAAKELQQRREEDDGIWTRASSLRTS